MSLYNSLFLFNKIYIMSFIFLGIINYMLILLMFFSFIFLFDLKNLKNLNDFNYFYDYSQYSYVFLIIVVSLAGTPPFLFFFLKIYSLVIIMLNNNIFILFLFVVFNIFIIYFYIQNLRFLKNKKKKNLFIFRNYYVNKNFKFSIFLLALLFFNLFGFIVFEELYYICYKIFLFL